VALDKVLVCVQGLVYGVMAPVLSDAGEHAGSNAHNRATLSHFRVVSLANC
jgi:hypothetical protein